MKNIQNTKTTTLLVSIYSWEGRTPKTEDVFEVQIRNMEDMTILTHRLGYKVKYKKPTDKNWNTYRAMTKRLFKKEIHEERENLKPIFVAVNDLNLVLEERRKVKEEKERKIWRLEASIYEIKDQIAQLKDSDENNEF
jgi:molybdopterin converting factor small subunit